MEYHQDRFRDASLLVRDGRGRVLALLPACFSPADAATVVSHAGLTYGGLLLQPAATGALVGEVLRACCAHYAAMSVRTFIYKPMPYIYHTYPADEDLYWLFRHGARLTARALSSVIDLRRPYAFSTLRRRKAARAAKSARLRLETADAYLFPFWSLLHNVLQRHHHTAPVHSYAELALLKARFPEQIRLFVAVDEASAAPVGSVLAGCLLFVTREVVHVQYIAAGDEGRQLGALDWLFAEVLQAVRRDYPEKPYFDFGISTEQGGRVLNEGLAFQKEGLGGRAVCYDVYQLELAPFCLSL